MTIQGYVLIACQRVSYQSYSSIRSLPMTFLYFYKGDVHINSDPQQHSIVF